MPRKRVPREITAVAKELRELIDEFEANREDMSLREQVIFLSEIYHNVLTLGVSVVCEHGAPEKSGMGRILWYLQQQVGQVISGDELSVVSGISEWARRTRELRVEEGEHLYTGTEKHRHLKLPYDLDVDDYIYTSTQRDEDRAEHWHLLNEIRRMEGGFKDKARELLKRRLKHIVDVSELRYVSQDKYEPRRIRELVTQEGYLIATRNRGFTGLTPGQYMLLSPTPRLLQEHDRTIPEDVEKAVLARDKNYCRICHWHPRDWTPNDPRIPELHHINEHRHGGLNVQSNLVTLCSKCHDKVHAGTLVLPTRIEDFKPIPNG